MSEIAQAREITLPEATRWQTSGGMVAMQRNNCYKVDSKKQWQLYEISL